MKEMFKRPRLAYAAVAMAAAVLAFAAPAGSVGRYTDATGDGRGAPDITGVTVGSDPSGQIVFTIRLNGLAPRSAVETYLLLNTDLNLDTGEPDTLGADYFVVLDEQEHTYDFARWTGAEWADTPSSTVRVSGGSSSYTISINRSELGGTESLNFWVRTWSSPGAFDDAPDDGSWNYALAVGGPDIRGVLVSTTPASGPKAGKQFTVAPAGLQLAPGGETAVLQPQPDSYRCRATLGGRVVTGRGVGGCTFAIPKNARGKRLALALTVEYQGASKTVPYVYRVR